MTEYPPASFDVARRDDFIRSRGWKFVESVGSDCSPRKYFRLRKGLCTAILMESVPDDSPQSAPGHSIKDFLRLGEWLRANDVHAPEIYEALPEDGFVLMEDFGTISFHEALQRKSSPGPVYTMAVEVLRHLSHKQVGIELPEFRGSRVHLGRRRIIDWYLPAIRREKNPDGLSEEFSALWDEVEAGLPPCPQVFVHGDYHVLNLMWVPEEEGIGCVGVLDFQGAMIGPRPYDLANLLEDVRIEVTPKIRNVMLDSYCREMLPQEKKEFLLWYRILATQFHCRIMGQFLKLAILDGKMNYLGQLPLVAKYLALGLKDPSLAKIKHWLDKQGLDFSAVPAFNTDEIRSFIREDAF